MILKFKITRDESGAVSADTIIFAAVGLGLATVIVMTASSGTSQLSGSLNASLDSVVFNDTIPVVSSTVLNIENSGCISGNTLNDCPAPTATFQILEPMKPIVPLLGPNIVQN